jgi:c-di-GMP-related signal transduction protein
MFTEAYHKLSKGAGTPFLYKELCYYNNHYKFRNKDIESIDQAISFINHFREDKIGYEALLINLTGIDNKKEIIYDNNDKIVDIK